MTNKSKNIESLLRIFECEILGEKINDDSRKHNELFLSYLIEANVEPKDIFDLVINHNPKKGDKLFIKDIKDELWKDSLLKRDTFYFNNALKIVPKLVGPGEKMVIYREPKIIIKEWDVIEYFYKKNNLPIEWADKAKEEGAVKHLLNSFKRFNFVEQIDFLYSLIDYASDAKTLFDLKQHEMEFAEMYERDIRAAKLRGVDTIIWRFKDE